MWLTLPTHFLKTQLDIPFVQAFFSLLERAAASVFNKQYVNYK